MTIYLIITTCINNKIGVRNQQHRNNNYINSIKQTLECLPKEIIPIIVENNGKRATLLDDFDISVHYTNNNEHTYWHKGVNELMDIHSVIDEFKIQDEDIVIKLTGRYHPLNSHFFNFVIENQNNYDAFIKFFNVCTLQYMDNDCVLGLFAIKCKHLKQFYYNEARNASAEVQFATFVRQSNDIRLCPMEYLNIECCFADNLRLLRV